MNRLTFIGIAGVVFVTLALLATRPYIAESSPQLLTQTRAVEAAQGFLRACALPIPEKPPKATIQTRNGEADKWVIEWEEQYRLVLLGDSGQVRWFVNSRREYEHVRQIGRTGHLLLKSREDAVSFCTAMAKSIGLPGGAVLHSLKVVSDGDPKETDGNPVGHVVARFKPRPFGFQYLRGGPGMVLKVDKQDGCLVLFNQTWITQADPPVQRASRDEAIGAARTAHEAFYRDHRSPHRGQLQGSRTPELGYVVPNASFGGIGRRVGVAPRARLAYVVYFGEESVWVDAETGRVIGGEVFQ